MAKTSSKVVKITSDVVRRRSEKVIFSMDFGVKKVRFGCSDNGFCKKDKKFLGVLIVNKCENFKTHDFVKKCFCL